MTISIVIMQVAVSVAIMQVVPYFLQCIMHMTFSVVIMEVGVPVVAMYVIASRSNFIFFSLTDIHFSEIDPKTFKDIISSLHFTTSHKYSSKIKILCG